MNALPSLLADGGFPWPVLIFFLAVGFQVVAGIWRSLQSRDPKIPRPERPERAEHPPGEWSERGLSGSPSQARAKNPTARTPGMAGRTGSPLEALQARLERQLRGDRDWRAVPPPPLPTLEASARIEVAREPLPPTSEPLVFLDESANALKSARQHLTQADALTQRDLQSGIGERRTAQLALRRADQQLASASAATMHTQRHHTADSVAGFNPNPNPNLPTQLRDSLRDPASFRGAMILSIVLGKPKALEE